MIRYTTIHDFITAEISAYDSTPITVADGWQWSMKEHVKLSTLYKNSRYATGNKDDKPFDNITLQILRLQYRTEGFDVKDIVVYVNNPKQYFKSFLIRKFHERWALEEG